MPRYIDVVEVIYDGDKMKAMPAADVQEVKHGHWKAKDLDNFRKYEVVCSECGARFVGNYDAYDEPSEFNYCPVCGCVMDGKENEDDT